MKLKFLFAGALLVLFTSCAQQVCPTYTKHSEKQQKSIEKKEMNKETRV